MKKSRGIINLILTVAVICLLGFTSVVEFGATGAGAAKNIKLGLDLAGGVSITYQVKDENPTEEEMKDTIYKLQKRVEQYSTEATVIRKVRIVSILRFRVFQMRMQFWKSLGNRVHLNFRIRKGILS